jgi:hypothetical protein
VVFWDQKCKGQGGKKHDTQKSGGKPLGIAIESSEHVICARVGHEMFPG